MTIHTTEFDKPKYARVIGSFEMADSTIYYVGKVGKVLSYGRNDRGDTNEMLFMEMHGETGLKVFMRRDVELITKKEYFKECLHG